MHKIKNKINTDNKQTTRECREIRKAAIKKNYMSNDTDAPKFLTNSVLVSTLVKVIFQYTV